MSGRANSCLGACEPTTKEAMMTCPVKSSMLTRNQQIDAAVQAGPPRLTLNNRPYRQPRLRTDVQNGIPRDAAAHVSAPHNNTERRNQHYRKGGGCERGDVEREGERQSAHRRSTPASHPPRPTHTHTESLTAPARERRGQPVKKHEENGSGDDQRDEECAHTVHTAFAYRLLQM